MNRWLYAFSGIAFALVVAVSAASATADENRNDVKSEAEITPAIGKCLSKNREAVLFADHVYCTDYRAGKDYLKTIAPGTPLNVDLARECPTAPSQVAGTQDAAPIPFSARHLPSDVINQLLATPSYKIGSHGIRIFGAIFCKRLNLVGLELPSALVIDKSVFAEGIEVRNLRIKGDLSVDGGLVFKDFIITRSSIEGSFYGEEAFVQDLSVLETTVEGSISLKESVLFKRTRFDAVSISRELSVRGSILSHFVTQFSRIVGLLDLSYSEARCAYHINKSEIGFFVAKKAGFGTIAGPPSQGTDNAPWHSWRRTPSAAVEELLKNSAVKTTVSDRERCPIETKKNKAQFYLFDSRINSSLCIADFEWLAPYDGSYYPPSFTKPLGDNSDPITLIAINGINIGNNLILDLWSNQQSIHDRVLSRLHKLEIIGVRTGGLILDFGDRGRNFSTAVDGLVFDRIYDAHAFCDYASGQSGQAGQRKVAIIYDFTEQLQVPKVDNVLRWLHLNEIGSTQPFTAFATAFENAGSDSTPIKIARANREICERAAYWLLLPLVSPLCPSVARSAGGKAELGAAHASHAVTRTAELEPQTVGRTAEKSGPEDLFETLSRIPDILSDLAQLLFRGALYFIADHGFRPGKVLYWLTLTIVVFWLVFMLRLKVVAFSSKPKEGAEKCFSGGQGGASDKEKLRPISILFLFDRLLPHYQILRTNYEIDKYYKRIPLPEDASTTNLNRFRRLRIFEWYVEPITEQKEKDRIEAWLLVLQILGVIFAIFLAAAISALIAR